MAMKSPPDILEVVQRHVALTPVRTLWGTPSTYRGLCPFHEEKTASFHVNVSAAVFHCFGCGAGGDVTEFLDRMRANVKDVVREFAPEDSKEDHR